MTATAFYHQLQHFFRDKWYEWKYVDEIWKQKNHRTNNSIQFYTKFLFIHFGYTFYLQRCSLLLNFYVTCILTHWNFQSSHKKKKKILCYNFILKNGIPASWEIFCKMQIFPFFSLFLCNFQLLLLIITNNFSSTLMKKEEKMNEIENAFRYFRDHRTHPLTSISFVLEVYLIRCSNIT